MISFEIRCKRCGKIFIHEKNSLRGANPIYCSSCRKIEMQNSRQKYRDKQKGLKNSELNQPIEDIQKNEADKDYMNYASKTLDLLGQLDTLRVNMCNLATELAEYQSNYDKQDQEFLHQIELNNFKTGNEALEFVNNWHKDRASRRNVKNLIKLLRDIISVIPMKTKFAAINNIQNIKLKEKNVINDSSSSNQSYYKYQ